LGQSLRWRLSSEIRSLWSGYLGSSRLRTVERLNVWTRTSRRTLRPVSTCRWRAEHQIKIGPSVWRRRASSSTSSPARSSVRPSGGNSGATGISMVTSSSACSTCTVTWPGEAQVSVDVDTRFCVGCSANSPWRVGDATDETVERAAGPVFDRHRARAGESDGLMHSDGRVHDARPRARIPAELPR